MKNDSNAPELLVPLLYLFVVIDVFALLLSDHMLFEGLEFISMPMKLLSFLVVLVSVFITARISFPVLLVMLSAVALGIIPMITEQSVSVVSYLFHMLKFLLLCFLPLNTVKRAVLFYVKLIFALLPFFLLYFDSVSPRGGVDFGFSNENKLPFLLGSVLLSLFLISDHRNSYVLFKFAAVLALVFAAYYGQSRTPLITAAVLFLVYGILKLVPFLARLSALVPLIVIFATVALSTTYSDNKLVNKILSSRPANWNNFVQMEELALFPSQLKISQFKEGLTDSEFRAAVGTGDNRAYFFDNAYLNILYRCGIVLSVILLAMMLYLLVAVRGLPITAAGVTISLQMFSESAIFFPMATLSMWMVVAYLSLRQSAQSAEEHP